MKPCLKLWSCKPHIMQVFTLRKWMSIKPVSVCLRVTFDDKRNRTHRHFDVTYNFFVKTKDLNVSVLWWSVSFPLPICYFLKTTQCNWSSRGCGSTACYSFIQTERAGSNQEKMILMFNQPLLHINCFKLVIFLVFHGWLLF